MELLSPMIHASRPSAGAHRERGRHLRLRRDQDRRAALRLPPLAHWRAAAPGETTRVGARAREKCAGNLRAKAAREKARAMEGARKGKMENARQGHMWLLNNVARRVHEVAQLGAYWCRRAQNGVKAARDCVVMRERAGRAKSWDEMQEMRTSAVPFPCREA
eukprot:4422530-Pleurochrysis_carterae.AAC.1